MNLNFQDYGHTTPWALWVGQKQSKIDYFSKLIFFNLHMLEKK